MEIKYRRLISDDLDRFIAMRINQLREEGAKEDTDLRPALLDYYTRHTADGTFVSWLAVDGEKIVGTSGMSFVEKPPYFGCPSGKMGLLSSMYTDPEYRRHSPGASVESCRRGAEVRLRHCADNRLGYGRTAVYGFRIRKERQFHAV